MRAKSLRTASGSTPVAGSAAPSVPDLRHPTARQPALAGAKASRLARAAEVGLPVVPGFVITTRAAGRGAAADDAVHAWRALSDDGRVPVVVRSSSSVEDGERSSMAGRFTSVLNVRDEEGFRAALAEVAASGDTIELDAPGGKRPMAILVQRQLEPRWSGVAFGFDPVSGRRDRRVIAAVEGLPDGLVGGSTFGRQVVLSRHGRVVESTGVGPALPRSVRQAVLGLAERSERLFRSPQDIEWAVDDGRAYLLQSRPITAATLPAAGPLLGPGPVAETLPDPLWPLEESLWVDPLRAAVRRTLAITGTASRRRLASSPVIVSVHGRVAADLALVGVSRTTRRGLAKLDPRPPLRRLGAAWRVGRLRAALPALAKDVVADVDEALAAIPALSTLDDEGLLSLLRRSAQALVAVHGHEMLAALLTVRDRGSTAAGAALAAVAAGRREGCSDAEIIRAHPVVLALSAPAIGSAPALAPSPDGDGAVAAADDTGPLSIREALRLRARWLQELEARAIRELVRRRAVPASEPDVRLLTQTELEDLVRTGATPLDWRDRRPPRPTPPLPAAFRLTADGTVVATRAAGSELAGQGAGGGRGIGPVDVAPTPAAGTVLVVRTLDPALASQLPHLAGQVAETGSVLSHLAILAREHGVPTVVGVERALERFTPGDVVIVDGLTGEVSVAPPGDEVTAR